MTTPTEHRIITPETLQALSRDAFASVRELVEVEDQRRISAMLVRYPMPGEPIRTPRQAVDLVQEAGASPRHEWLVAILMRHTHQALALYQIYCGQECPLPCDLNPDFLVLAAKAYLAQRMILIRYHPHPYVGPTLEEASEVKRCRLAVKAGGTPMYDYVILDRRGSMFSIRGWGALQQQETEAAEARLHA
jgi:hypothetical protein